jgi:hypothetical protein
MTRTAGETIHRMNQDATPKKTTATAKLTSGVTRLWKPTDLFAFALEIIQMSKGTLNKPETLPAGLALHARSIRPRANHA